MTSLSRRSRISFAVKLLKQKPSLAGINLVGINLVGIILAGLILPGLILPGLIVLQSPVICAQEKEASAASKKADQEKPKYPDVEDGIQLFKKGNVSGAMALFKKAKKENPEISPPEVMMARLYFAARKPGLGKASLQTAVVSYPKDPEAWANLAEFQYRSGNWAEAELLYRYSIDLTNKSDDSNSVRMRNQLRQCLSGLAKTYEIRKLWNQAMTHLIAWTQIEPQNILAWQRLANVQLNLGMIKEARGSLTKARKLNPKLLPHQVMIGMYYQRKGMQEDAKAEMMQAIEQNGGSLSTQIAVARWAISAGDWKQASQCIEVAKALDEDSLAPVSLLANLNLFRGNNEEAEAGFQQIHQTHPGNYEAAIGLAMSLLKQDDESKLKQGLEYAKVIVKSHKDIRLATGRKAAAILGWALYKNGQLKQAGEVIQQIIRTGELDSDSAYIAAEICRSLGQEDLARKLNEGALSSRARFVLQSESEVLAKKLKD